MMATDSEVAAMVEIARSAGSGLSRDGRALVGQLIEQGYVAETADSDGGNPRLKVTPAGQSVLDERGVGANKS